MGTVTTWAAIVGAVIAGCLVAERMRSRTDAELIAARRRWLLVAVALLFIYMLGGREFYGFGIFGLLCVLPLFVLIRHRRYRTFGQVAAALAGFLGLTTVLPFILLGGPLLLVAACVLASARTRQTGSETAPAQGAQQASGRHLPPGLRLLVTTNVVVLVLALAVALGSARPG